MEKDNFYYGIDFGTTNSTIVRTYDTGDELIYNHYGDNQGEPYPSLFGFDKNGEEITGRRAWEKRREIENETTIISSVKSVLGTDKSWLINGREWTPVEVASSILVNLKKENQLNEDIEAVISVPVGFTSEKRRLLKQAAEKAGIKVNSFVKESTAALFKSYKDICHYRNVLIFDWGGGTLDISLLDNHKGLIKELAVNTLDKGGDDIDIKIAKMVHSKLMRDNNIKKSFEEMEYKYQDIMIVQCEKAKRDLSIHDNTRILIPKYGEFGVVNTIIDIDLFATLINIEIEAAVNLTRKTIQDAGMSEPELDCIIMAGGTSKIRPLLHSIEYEFKNQTIVYSQDSEWKCAEGAALLSMEQGNYKLNENIGILLSDNSYFAVYEAGETINQTKKIFEFALTEDSRTARFIFASKDSEYGNNNILGNIIVNTFGFMDELLIFEATIDENLVFKTRIFSSKRSDTDYKEWEYDRLKFSYELPVIMESE